MFDIHGANRLSNGCPRTHFRRAARRGEARRVESCSCVGSKVRLSAGIKVSSDVP